MPTYGQARKAAQDISRHEGIRICNEILATETDPHVRRDAKVFKKALEVSILKDKQEAKKMAELIAKSSELFSNAPEDVKSEDIADEPTQGKKHTDTPRPA